VEDPASIGIVFVALAVVFVGIALRDYLKTTGNMTIAQKVWIRMAFIFAGVAIGLYLVQTLFW
jgi:hypothetical protein